MENHNQVNQHKKKSLKFFNDLFGKDKSKSPPAPNQGELGSKIISMEGTESNSLI